jgi:hypothetical protein
MKPPLCAYCRRNFRSHPELEFKLVRFKKSTAQVEREAKRKDENYVGHPANVEWFCNEHIEHAKANTSLTLQAYWVRLSNDSEEE